MSDELMNFDLPVERSSIIKILGIGGGGNNAVNHMYKQEIRDVNFVICNTDSQALAESPVPVKVQIGEALTEGRGAGSLPDNGRGYRVTAQRPALNKNQPSRRSRCRHCPRYRLSRM